MARLHVALAAFSVLLLALVARAADVMPEGMAPEAYGYGGYPYRGPPVKAPPSYAHVPSYDHDQPSYPPPEYGYGYGREPEPEFYGPSYGYSGGYNPDASGIPAHVELKIFATSLEHFNMSKAESSSAQPAAARAAQATEGASDDDGARHAAVMKMYQAFCETDLDNSYDTAVMLPYIGHLHVWYQPKHHQMPVKLWGQTGLYVAYVKNITLAHGTSDKSICNTLFTEETIFVPLENIPMYTLLSKPYYPANLKYVLSGEAMYPIGMLQSSKYDDPSHSKAEGGHASPVKVKVEPQDVCDIAQILRGKLAIATKVGDTPVLYVGKLFAVPAMEGDASMNGMPMPMAGRWPSVRMEDDYSDALAAMCHPSVKRVVPWMWHFDFTRVELSKAKATLGDAAFEKVRALLGDPVQQQAR